MAPPDSSAGTAEEIAEWSTRCKTLISSLGSPSFTGWDRAAVSNVEFLSCARGRTEWSFTVDESQCNASGNLHGGCAATILDDLTSTPAFTLTTEGYLEAGSVSRNLSCTYLRGLPIGTKVHVVCETVNAGRTLICFKGEMRDEQGRVAVLCVHDKVPRRSTPKL